MKSGRDGAALNDRSGNDPLIRSFAIIIPTIGIRPNLHRLVQSIVDQHFSPCEIVVINQGSPEVIWKQLEEWVHLDISVVQTHPGVAHARNVGLQSLKSAWDVVGMVDDDCWYDSGVFERVIGAFKPGVGAVSTRVRTIDDGRDNRVGFGTKSLVLDSRTVWTHAMESGSFFARGFFDEVGLYNENLGIGSATPWQSGEGTELMLRGLAKGQKMIYLPDAIVWEDTLPPTTDSSLLKRSRRYARGTGRVIRKQTDVLDQARFVLRSIGRVLVGLRHHSLRRTRTDLEVLAGRIEGLLGRTFGP